MKQQRQRLQGKRTVDDKRQERGPSYKHEGEQQNTSRVLP